MTRAYGGVVVDGEGRVLLRRPAGEFDGYVWTFAKGRPDGSEGPEETALREVREETGYICEIVSSIPGEFAGGTGTTTYYLMRPLSPGSFDVETSEIRWVTSEEAEALLRETRNEIGRARDLTVLVAALKKTRDLGATAVNSSVAFDE